MGDSPLSGISIGSSSIDKEMDGEDVDELLQELEVENLSELSSEQLSKVKDVLSGTEQIEGIITQPEEGERTSTQLRAVTRQIADEETEDIFEKQLEQIQDIQQDTEVLRRIAASIGTTNEILSRTNALLDNIVDATMRGPALDVKDANEVTLDKANDSIQVVSDTNISTSLVVFKPDASNSGAMYVGDSNVEINAGLKVEGGETRVFKVDALSDEFHVTAEDAGDTYSYLALGLVEGI